MTLRERIMEYLEDWGSATVSQLQEDLGAPRTSVAKHLHNLQWDGDASIIGTVETKTRPAVLWGRHDDR